MLYKSVLYRPLFKNLRFQFRLQYTLEEIEDIKDISLHYKKNMSRGAHDIPSQIFSV